VTALEGEVKRGISCGGDVDEQEKAEKEGVASDSSQTKGSALAVIILRSPETIDAIEEIDCTSCESA
jgi:hypothetical protein